MKLTNAIYLLATLSCASAACVNPWGQCGGANYNGDKCCVSGYTCKYFNEWYSQCVQGGNSNAAPAPNPPKVTTTKKTTTKKTTVKKTTVTNQQPTYQPSYPSNNQASSVKWPKAQKTVKLSTPLVIKAGQTYDGLAVNGVWTSYGRGVYGQGDCKNVEGGSKDAVFRLETGATLKNVIIGADSIEHVHCVGDSCTVENVWWDDVCEDALSLKDSTNPNAKFYLTGGGARNGSDKIVQHNSSGTVYIKNFDVQNAGKLYRSCGNCKKGYQGRRDVVIENVTAVNVGTLAGINANYGDTATIKNVTMNKGTACAKFTGNNNGKEPTKIGSMCNNSLISNCVCKN